MGFLITGILAFLTLSCNNDDDVSTDDVNKEYATVSFELDASELNMGVISRAISPSYDAGGFSIYAFKQAENGVDYEFAQTLNLAGATYIPETKTLLANATLEVGTYKFLPAYGLISNPNIAVPFSGNQRLSDEISLQHAPSQTYGNNLSEIFLYHPQMNYNRMEDIPAYTMNTVGNLNQSVRLRISRAVARVDVMFIRAVKNGNSYTEVPTANGQDVFGNQGLGKLELRFDNLNQSMNLLGISQPGTFDATMDVQNLGIDGDAVTIGTRQSASIIGTPDYIRFDSIRTDDIIYGAAHVFGSYLIPNNDESRTVSLQVYMETANGSRSRAIDISLDNQRLLPLVRNKVTLVKIYILPNEGGGEDPNPPVPPVPPVPPGPGIFESDVMLEVVIETDWDLSNSVEQPIRPIE